MRVRRLVNNDMSFGRGLGNFAKDSEAVAQKVATRLRLLQEEWFLDTDDGVPYLQKIMTRPADRAYYEATLKARILATVGVETLDQFSTFLNNETRVLDVKADVGTIYNTTENIKVTV